MTGAPACCPTARVMWDGQSGSSRTGVFDHWRCTGCGQRLTTKTA